MKNLVSIDEFKKKCNNDSVLERSELNFLKGNGTTNDEAWGTDGGDVEYWSYTDDNSKVISAIRVTPNFFGGIPLIEAIL